jgi:sugar/nucleoside kinase (ribokinase family)
MRSSKLEFLAVGHFTHDVTDRGLILGGAAAYSTLAAKKLGLRVGVISAVGGDFLHYDKLEDIALHLVNNAHNANSNADSRTTTFHNVYENGVRRQTLRSVSDPILPQHIPSEWLDSQIVYLCPVADEVHPDVVHKFPNSLIGISPQGWMRQWDAAGHVSPRKWKDAPKVLPNIEAVIMSEEDITPFPEIVDEYREMAKVVILTRGHRGSTLFHKGQTTDFPAYQTKVMDPTGAGDVFAVAFLSELRRSGDLRKASIFANCTASFVVEKKGTNGIPDLKSVQERMESYGAALA